MPPAWSFRTLANKKAQSATCFEHQTCNYVFIEQYICKTGFEVNFGVFYLIIYKDDVMEHQSLLGNDYDPVSPTQNVPECFAKWGKNGAQPQQVHTAGQGYE